MRAGGSLSSPPVRPRYARRPPTSLARRVYSEVGRWSVAKGVQGGVQRRCSGAMQRDACGGLAVMRCASSGDCSTEVVVRGTPSGGLPRRGRDMRCLVAALALSTHAAELIVQLRTLQMSQLGRATPVGTYEARGYPTKTRMSQSIGKNSLIDNSLTFDDFLPPAVFISSHVL